MILDETTRKLIIVSLLLIFGYTFSRVSKRSINSVWQKNHGPTIEDVRVARITSNIINAAAIIIALSILRINITETTFMEIYSFVPRLLSYILLVILIVLLARMIYWFTEKIIDASGIKGMAEEYGEDDTLQIAMLAIRFAIYLIVALIVLSAAGINITSTVRLLEGIIYPVFILSLVFLFFGLKPHVENVFTGYFLKRKKFFHTGEIISVGEKSYTIDELKADAAILEDNRGVLTHIPYRRLYEYPFSFKEIVYDLDTLEKIKDNFLAQQPSFCGPASASMILKIFGFDISQDDIGKFSKTIVTVAGPDGVRPPGGTRPKNLITAVEILTDKQVKGVWLNIEKITDLKTELKTWLADKALVIIDYKKSFLFPDAKRAHYSVCLSVRGDELLILDPSSKKGGVYFADIKNVYLGMNTYSELLKSKRGYIVLAPKGTPAYHRIEKGMIYSDPSLYGDINKGLLNEVERLRESAASFENVLPKSIKTVIDEYKKKEKIRRVWKPDSEM